MESALNTTHRQQERPCAQHTPGIPQPPGASSTSCPSSENPRAQRGFRGEATCSEDLPRPCVPCIRQAGLQSGINKSTSKFLSSPFHVGFSVCACDCKNQAGTSYSSVFSKREHICVSARGSPSPHLQRARPSQTSRFTHSGLRPARMTPRVQRQQNLSDLIQQRCRAMTLTLQDRSPEPKVDLPTKP